MSMVIKVQWEDGRPCQGTRVTAWIDGQGNDEAYTNYNGEAFFTYGPGYGTIYCDGQQVRQRNLSSHEIITCRQSGIFGGYTYH